MSSTVFSAHRTSTVGSMRARPYTGLYYLECFEAEIHQQGDTKVLPNGKGATESVWNILEDHTNGNRDEGHQAECSH